MSGDELDSSYGGFTGVFDGAGFTITYAMNVAPGPSDTTNDLGLFGYVNGGTVENLVLHGGTISGGSYLGAIAGEETNATFTNVSSNTVIGGSDHLGGLVGSATTSFFRGASSSGNVAGPGNDVGGLIGFLQGDDDASSVASEDRTHYVTQSFATGHVTGTSSVGGLVGSLTQGAIANSYAAGVIIETGSGESNIGGLVGSGEWATIEQSYFGGLVLTISGTPIGGLLGHVVDPGSGNHSLIANSFMAGEATDTVPAVLGDGDSVTDFTNDFYDSTTEGAGTCYGGGAASVTGCTAVDPGGVPTYWKDPANDPVSGWNLDSVWNVHSPGDFPVLYPYIDTTGDMQISVVDGDSDPVADARVEVSCPGGAWTVLGTTNGSGFLYSNISTASDACPNGVGDGDGTQFRAYALTYAPSIVPLSTTYYTDIDPVDSGTFHDGSSNSIAITLGPTTPFSGSGSGTSIDPYVITSCSQLLEINNDLGASYLVDASGDKGTLDCAGGAFPVARQMSGSSLDLSSTGFFGTLDGGGNTIDFNLNHIPTDDTTDYLGLFGFVNGGTVENVTLGLHGDVDIVGHSYIGLAAGAAANATFSDITSATNVTYSGTSETNGFYGDDMTGNTVTGGSFTGTYTYDNPIAFVSPPTPADETSQSTGSIEVETSSSDLYDGHYVLDDFDGSLAGWWRLEGERRFDERERRYARRIADADRRKFRPSLLF